MGTWSYTVMGNKDAWVSWARFYELVSSSSLNENNLELTLEKRMKYLIETMYEDLIKLTIDCRSRLAYQVLGVFLMEFGAKMTYAVRELILIHSRWEDEKEQLFDERDRSERFYHLSNFREKVINYRNVKETVFYESPASIVVELKRQNSITTDYPLIAPPQRRPIDYCIK